MSDSPVPTNGHNGNGLKKRKSFSGDRPTGDMSLKETRWLEAYWETGNPTRAAELAGYKGSANTLCAVGWQNLRKHRIRERIAQRLEDAKSLTGEEVIGTLADQMRSDPADLFDEEGRFDFFAMKKGRLGHLIKKFKIKRSVEGKGEDAEPVDFIDVELHSQQAAAIQLSRILGLEKAPKSQEDPERERKVTFLVRTIKTGMAANGDVTIEQCWAYCEKVERERFGEDIGDLRPAVFAALGVGESEE